MTSVLVTGAAGFVGRALCPALGAAGHQISVTVRRPETTVALGQVQTRPARDVGPETDWRDSLAGIEAVVHLAARAHVNKTSPDETDLHRRINAKGAVRLAEQAAAAGVRRLIFLSTVKVNGEASGEVPFRESDPPAPADAYGRSKWEAEQGLAEVAARTGILVVVLRPPLVYGPHVKGNFLTLLEVCRKAPPLPLASVANRRSLIYLGNLVDAILSCLTHPQPRGTYVVRDGEDVSTPELIRRVATALGRPARLFPMPAPMVRLAGRLTGNSDAVSRLVDTLVVDDGRIRRDLGWAPPFTMREGLAHTAAWFASDSEPRKDES